MAETVSWWRAIGAINGGSLGRIHWKGSYAKRKRVKKCVVKGWATRAMMRKIGSRRIRDSEGNRAVEEALFGSPVGLAEVRTVVANALRYQDGEVWTADVDTAYLQAELKGKPKYILP